MSVKLAVVLLATLTVVQSANLLDFLNLEDAKKLVEVAAADPEPREVPNCKWKCKGPACACCIERNITSYDPEGTKCVHMRYLSKEEGLFVQVSHGKKVEYDKIPASNPGPLCLVLGVLFQMCTSFAHMAPTPEGLKGCVYLEPGTIFLSQRKIPLGCFKASEAGMEMMEPIDAPVEEEEETAATDNSSEDGDGEFDPDKFFAGVYQTAQQSIALLSSLIEPINPNKTPKPSEANEPTTAPPESQETTSSQRRAPKNLKHPNQL